jgi:UDP-glucose 4-epimerase
VRWLVTGGCGFIGTSLIRRLAGDSRHRIRVLDNLSSGSRGALASVCAFSEGPLPKASPTESWGEQRIELIVGDILQEQQTLSAGCDIDVMVHLAANTGVGPSVDNPRMDCLVNVVGTLNALESARINRVKRFVFASSGAPVGECIPPIHEEIVPHPVSPYGASKLAGEAYCSAYFRTFGVETVALRFGNVYGPRSGHKNSVVAQFIRNALNGRPLEIYGDGHQTRDFVYIDDLVEAIVSASHVPNVGGEVFQIATASETSIGQLAMDLQVALGEAGIKQPTLNYTATRIGDVRRNYSDCTKAERLLGWKPSSSRLEGLRRTVEWFQRELTRP